MIFIMCQHYVLYTPEEGRLQVTVTQRLLRDETTHTQSPYPCLTDLATLNGDLRMGQCLIIAGAGAGASAGA